MSLAQDLHRRVAEKVEQLYLIGDVGAARALAGMLRDDVEERLREIETRRSHRIHAQAKQALANDRAAIYQRLTPSQRVAFSPRTRRLKS